MDYHIFDFLAVILGIGFIYHLFNDKELTFSYIFKKCCLPILTVLILCILISFITHNIFIMLLPVWLLLLYWAICGYIKIFKALIELFITLKK